ncbi:hypothetical protein DITRI_Ditri20bG0042500 [Diplodiscus trichospermus]
MDDKPFLHKHYLLFDHYNNKEETCDKCNQQIHGWAYNCERCNFWLDSACAEQQLRPQISHPLHSKHLLTLYYNVIDFVCDKCFTLSRGHRYHCGDCNFKIDVSCAAQSTNDEGVSLEKKESKRSGDRHTLTLVKGFVEDDFGEYYCDICEEERNSKHHVYCCENCSYIAHIQCAIKKVYSKGLTPELTNQEETEKSKAESQNHDLERRIEHFAHRHPLNYYEVMEKKEDFICKACNLEIYGEAYGCESCKYYLHKTCARLSYEVLHPLHPQHPLKLFAGSESFICPECKDFSLGFTYVCYMCNFILDVKCATIATPDNESQRRKEMDRESKLCPFRQDHELFFFNNRLKPEEDFNCSICFLPITGPTYNCISCGYFLHESCFGFPREIKLPLIHPEQPLRPNIPNKTYFSRLCFACRVPLYEHDIVYNCEAYEFNLHLSCANSLRRAIHSKFHEHPLFYFGADCQKLFQNKRDIFMERRLSKCNKCNKSFGSVPFCRCIMCDLSFHLECVVIPHFVKSRCHIHSLTLKDYFVEDNSGEYYCDICEEKRHPNHHIYFCEECQGLFVAHIECVLNNTAGSDVSTDDSMEEEQSNNESSEIEDDLKIAIKTLGRPQGNWE